MGRGGGGVGVAVGGYLADVLGGLCLCKRCDMVSEGQSWDHGGGGLVVRSLLFS